MSRVALISAKDAEPVDTDLPLLRAALERLGIEHKTYAWDDSAHRLDGFDLAVVRSTWDYVPRRGEFLLWARRVPCPLRNTADVLEWNTDKRYLAELESRGVAIVPTAWVGPGDSFAVPDDSAEEIVVKPTISAGAKDTARYGRDQREDAARHAERLAMSGRTAMVQPYVASVDQRGETGILFFGGELSHAIAKGPILRDGRRDIAGLFAAEEITRRDPSPEEVAFAERVLAAVPFPTPLYARVDMVQAEDGSLRLLELELTEPSVFLDVDPAAADRFANAIAREL